MPTTQLHEAAMSVDTVAARTDSAGGAVTPDWRAEERRMSYALFTEGVLPVPVNAYQTVEGAGGTMNIVVGSGAAEVDQALVAGQVAGQGKYMLRLDEATKTISLDAAGASDRTDELYLTMYDNAYDSQSRALPRFAIRKGDAGGAAPGPDANWEAYLLLASVFIPASAPNIAACTITDERVFTSLGAGLVAPDSLQGDVLLGSELMQMGRGEAIGIVLSTSIADKITHAFVLPSGWVTADVMVRSTMFIFIGSTNGGEWNLRCEIGASNGTIMAMNNAGAGINATAVVAANHKASVNGNVTLAAAASRTTGSTSGHSAHLTMEWWAFRTS